MTHAEHIAIARAIAKCQARLHVVDFEHARPGPTRDKWLELRNRMALGNKGLVHMVARKFAYPRTDPEDVVQWGFLGLLKAIDRFDPERGFHFSTYAMHWIRNEIQREAAKCDRLVRVMAMQRLRPHEGGEPDRLLGVVLSARDRKAAARAVHEGAHAGGHRA